MAKYFTFPEMYRSDAAAKAGLTNIPPSAETMNLLRLMDNVLDPLREAFGRPITVNSGYRSPQVNKLVGGVANSQHVLGEAADITAGSKERNKRLFDLLVSLGIEFDQLIDERNYTWLHVSLKASGNRKQILHL